MIDAVAAATEALLAIARPGRAERRLALSAILVRDDPATGRRDRAGAGPGLDVGIHSAAVSDTLTST